MLDFWGVALNLSMAKCNYYIANYYQYGLGIGQYGEAILGVETCSLRNLLFLRVLQWFG